MRSDDLARQVARELRQLRQPGAPPTLLPRVMSAVHAWAARPWYERAWFTWPRGIQATAGVTLVLFVLTVALLGPAAFAAARAIVASLVTPPPRGVADELRDLEHVLIVVRAVWGALVQPLLAYAFPLVALMSLVCGSVAAALNRVAFGRVYQS